VVDPLNAKHAKGREKTKRKPLLDRMNRIDRIGLRRAWPFSVAVSGLIGAALRAGATGCPKRATPD